MLPEFSTLPNLKLSERQQLPECPAIYFAVSRTQVLYVGLATNLKRRWQGHHRLQQLEAINNRAEVTLFWLSCPPHQLQALEQQYIEHYCPTFNQTRVPERLFIPSSRMLSLSLQKLHNRLLGFGVCPAHNRGLKILLLGYLASDQETRLATTTVRKTLQAISKKPDSLFRWTETTRRKEGAHWRTRCNGVEVRLMPWFRERIMHNPSMYEVMSDRRFGARASIPMSEYEAMRQQVRAMSFTERLELIQGSKVGQQLFPLECGAHFVTIHEVDILCLTGQQLQAWLSEHSHLQNQYPAIQAINDNPLPVLRF